MQIYKKDKLVQRGYKLTLLHKSVPLILEYKSDSFESRSYFCFIAVAIVYFV